MRPFRTRFRFGFPRTVNLAAYRELAGSFFKRHAVTRSWLPRNELRQLVGSRFQVLFHSPPGVLFTFPSRYWSTIGRQGVLSLRGWAPRIRTGFQGSRATREHRGEAGRVSTTGLLPPVAALSMAFVYVPALSLPDPTGAGSRGSHDTGTATPPGYHTVPV